MARDELEALTDEQRRQVRGRWKHTTAGPGKPDYRAADKGFEGDKGDPSNSTGFPMGSTENSPAGTDDPKAGLRNQERNPDQASRGRASRAASPENLKDGEDNAADSVNYTGGDKKGGKKEVKGKKGWWNKKKVGFAGAIAGTGVIGSILGLSIISGPFEIIHMAQLYQKTHFSNLQDASDSRMGKLYRFINSGGDASQTRLGALANHFKNTMLGQLSDKGMEPAVGKFATLDGWNLDTHSESPDSPFKDMNEAQIKDYLIEAGVPDGSFTITPGDKGIFTVTANKGGLNFLKSYRNQKGLLQFMVGQADESKIPNALRTRWLGKAFGISWHPFTQLKGALNNKVNAALIKAWEALRDKALRTGQGGSDIADATKAKDKTTDGKGKTHVTPENGGVTSDGPGFTKGLQNIKDALNSPGGKIAGGLAAAIGIICLFKTVSDNYGDIQYAKVFVPVMRLGMQIIVMGNQIMLDKGADLSEMGAVAKQFYDIKTKMDWSESKPVQSESGLPMTGQDVDATTKGMLGERPPSWLIWTDNPVIGTLCSTGGQVVSGIVSFALGIFSGELASTAIQAAAGALVEPAAISSLTKIATNEAVDVAGAVGPEFGGLADYGARMAATQAGVPNGAIKTSDFALAAMANVDQQEQTQIFEHKSLAYRLFDPYDDQTLISKVLDNSAPTVSGNAMNLADTLMGMGHTLASLPMNLFSSIAHADTVTLYKYPFAAWGFSAQDLTSPLVANPYSNAGDITPLLENNNKGGEGDYIGLASKCFGVNVQKVTETDGTQDWDVIPNGQGINVYNNTQNTNDYYNASDCASPQESGITKDNWLRLRFFIFDTGVMEGWACEHGDDKSCENDGVLQSTTISKPIGGGINLDESDAQDLIQKSGLPVSYAVYDTDGDQLASYQGDTENYGASITKAMVLVAYLNQVKQDALTQDAKNHLHDMIYTSDNVAADWVYGQLHNGPQQINDVASAAGMTGFHIDTSDTTYTLGQSKITANDFASFFAKIDNYMNTSDANKSYAMDLLANLSPADQTGILQAGIQGTVWSKEGWKQEPPDNKWVINQAAQFNDSGSKYGIAITLSGANSKDAGETLVKQVAETLLGTKGN